MKIRMYALHLAFGGVEKAITNMANIFVEQRHDVEIICLYQMPNAPAYELHPNVKVIYLLDVVPNKKEFRDACKSRHPFRILKEGLASIRILYLKKVELKKHMRAQRNCVVITTRHEDTLLFQTCKHTSVYAIAQLHHDHQPRLLKQIAKSYTHIDTLCLLSNELRDEVKAVLPKGHTLKCITIPNFLDTIPKECSFEAKIDECIAVGRLHEVKGFSRMIHIFAKVHRQLPNCKLRIVGDGELYSELGQQIQQLQLEDVVFLEGKKESNEIEKMNQKASLYLMTSYSEGLPLVLIEAQSCALPIIAFDVRVGPRTVIENGKTGYLIPDNNEDLFVQRLITLMNDSERRKQMSHAAYQASYRYAKETVCKLWLDELSVAQERMK